MLFSRRAPKAEKLPTEAELKLIAAADSSLYVLPWKGSPCIVRARELSDIEIYSLPSFSLIETDEYKWSKAKVKVPLSEQLDYAEIIVKICMASLISPTYDAIFEVVGKYAFNLKAKTQVEDINRMLKDIPVGPARQELEGMRDALVLAWEYILPDDFLTGILAIALGREKSDIKKVTEDMLYTAAVLAYRGHKAPHEYIHGAFTSFNVRDIDTQALIIYENRMEALREEARQRKGA